MKGVREKGYQRRFGCEKQDEWLGEAGCEGRQRVREWAMLDGGDGGWGVVFVCYR